MKPSLYPVPAVCLVVALLIRAELLGKRRQVFVFKPIATLLVILVALLAAVAPSQNRIYSSGVLIGLALSLGGDIALMFDQDRRAFALGLGLFLLAHVAYTVVFTLLGRFSAWDVPSLVVLAAAGTGFYRLIQEGLGPLRCPVIAYMVVISVMVSRALSTLPSPVFEASQAIMVASGAILFYISDVILAANRFWKPLPYDRASLAFYYAGQLLLALGGSQIAGP